ncbi:hypothetical protein Taro_020840 [Colocasia esculenta]|uniref:Uncharacterized protein n=1 Tax=Colocasia esculenta TaxID=4460 RepID=A0A843V6F5_COLES|nr:hypothetical protein [Colocasia esculenta]
MQNPEIATGAYEEGDRAGYKPCKVWFRFDLPFVDFKMTVCAGRSRHNGEEDELLVVVPQLLSHQELLHTTPASSKLVPRVSFYDSIKASLTPWHILSSTWLVLQHRTIRNTVVTTSAFQARPELLPAFLQLGVPAGLELSLPLMPSTLAMVSTTS